MLRTSGHLLPIASACVALVLVACSPGTKGTAPPKEATSSVTPTSGASGQTTHAAVEITGSGFVPATIQVKVGQSVVWLNSTKIEQRISIAGGPESPAIAPGNNVSHVFSTAGTYSYSDPLHPGFKGAVAVK